VHSRWNNIEGQVRRIQTDTAAKYSDQKQYAIEPLLAAAAEIADVKKKCRSS